MNFIGTNNDLNFGGDILFPQGRTVKITQVQDNATWTRGSQTLLFGGEFDYQNSPNALLYYYNGELDLGTLSNVCKMVPADPHRHSRFWRTAAL